MAVVDVQGPPARFQVHVDAYVCGACEELFWRKANAARHVKVCGGQRDMRQRDLQERHSRRSQRSRDVYSVSVALEPSGPEAFGSPGELHGIVKVLLDDGDLRQRLVAGDVQDVPAVLYLWTLGRRGPAHLRNAHADGRAIKLSGGGKMPTLAYVKRVAVRMIEAIEDFVRLYGDDEEYAAWGAEVTRLLNAPGAFRLRRGDGGPSFAELTRMYESDAGKFSRLTESVRRPVVEGIRGTIPAYIPRV